MYGSVIIFSKAKAEVGIVPFQSGALTYNGSEQSPVWNGFDASSMEISGTTSAVDAGTYTAVITLKEGYVWADGSNGAKSVTWTIRRATTAVPTQSGSLTYTGAELTASFSGYDSSKMTLGGTIKGTNAGSYNATFTPGANFQWPDGTTTAKTVSWTIGMAAGSLSLSKTALTLEVTSKTGTITVNRAGNGAITATSSDANVAAVSVSGNVVTVTGKTNGSATITVKVAAGTNHAAPANKTCAVTVSFAKIYGVSWDGASTTKWTRTDDAALFTDPVPYVAGATSYGSPFDNLQPWAGMVKSERTGGTMVAIPKFWYKLTQNGKGMSIQIADKATTGFCVSPAHMNRGDGKGEREVAYIGRFHCGSNWKSVTGQLPKSNFTRDDGRSGIHSLGENIWQMDFAMWFTLWLLYLVEFADWNSRETIGKGQGNTSTTRAMGYTDSMPYHTGTTQSSRDTYGPGIQYRNIEGMWDNVFDWCDGCYSSGNEMMIILDPNSFSDFSGGTSAGTPVNGWPSAFTVTSNGGFPMFVPSALGGGETMYSCDRWIFNTSSACIFVGGGIGLVGIYGLFHVGSAGVSYTYAGVGSRSQELP